MAEEVFTIRRRSLRSSGDVRGTNESKGNKIKDFDSFDIMFFYLFRQTEGLTAEYPATYLHVIE